MYFIGYLLCNLLELLYEEHRLDFFNRFRAICADGSPMRIVNREKHRTDNYYMINFLLILINHIFTGVSDLIHDINLSG